MLDVGELETGSSVTRVDWHQLYDVPGSMLARRLATVQDRISDALDTAPPGPLRAISMCAGQGATCSPSSSAISAEGM